MANDRPESTATTGAMSYRATVRSSLGCPASSASSNCHARKSCSENAAGGPGADGLARGGSRPDVHRPSGGRCLARLGPGPEVRPATRRELGLVADHAGGDAIDVRNIGTTEPQSVAAAGLLLFGSVGGARGRPHRDRQCRHQHQAAPKIPVPQKRHRLPPNFDAAIVGDRRGIRKRALAAGHSANAAGAPMPILRTVNLVEFPPLLRRRCHRTGHCNGL
jgi:hypothetical protein